MSILVPIFCVPSRISYFLLILILTFLVLDACPVTAWNAGHFPWCGSASTQQLESQGPVMLMRMTVLLPPECLCSNVRSVMVRSPFKSRQGKSVSLQDWVTLPRILKSFKIKPLFLTANMCHFSCQSRWMVISLTCKENSRACRRQPGRRGTQDGYQVLLPALPSLPLIPLMGYRAHVSFSYLIDDEA